MFCIVLCWCWSLLIYVAWDVVWYVGYMWSRGVCFVTRSRAALILYSLQMWFAVEIVLWCVVCPNDYQCERAALQALFMYLCKTCRRLDFKRLALTYSWIMDIRYQNKSWNHIEEKTVKHKEPEGSIGVHMRTAGVRAGAGEEHDNEKCIPSKSKTLACTILPLYYTYNITLRACSIQHLLLSSLCCRGVASWWKQKFYEILPTNSCRADHLLQELGVQPPVGFWDPLGLSKDGDVEASSERHKWKALGTYRT